MEETAVTPVTLANRLKFARVDAQNQKSRLPLDFYFDSLDIEMEKQR